MLLDADESQLVLVDYQTRLMPAIHDGAAVLLRGQLDGHSQALSAVVDSLIRRTGDLSSVAAVLGAALCFHVFLTVASVTLATMGETPIVRVALAVRADQGVGAPRKRKAEGPALVPGGSVRVARHG